MTDPGTDLLVVSLHYALLPGRYVTYDNPPRVEFETDDARFLLEDGHLRCDMLRHFGTEQEARAAVEPILDAWVAKAELTRRPDELRFGYETAEIIDRSPPTDGVVRANSSTPLGILPSATGTLGPVARQTYPDPPSAFRLNPDATSALLRYRGYQAGREPLLAMAYFCLTVVEAISPGPRPREPAAIYYNIDYDVLKNVGKLSSTHGDGHSARKATASHPLTELQSAWLEAAIKLLLLRLGDTRDPSTLPIITMGDLPPL